MQRLPSSALAALALTALASLPAQQEPLVRIGIRDMPGLIAAYEKSALARLVADEDVVDAVHRAIDFGRRDIARRQATLRAAIETGVPLDPSTIANQLRQPDLYRVFYHPLPDVRDAEFVAFPGESNEMWPRTVMRLSCLPRYEGQWTRAFLAEAELMAKAPWLESVEGAKVEGNPAFAFVVPGSEEERNFLAAGPVGLWMLHVPGTFVYGSGAVDNASELVLPEPEGPPGVALRMNLALYVEMFLGRGGGMPREFEALGFDKLNHLEWRGSFVGELLLDEFELELSGEPSGLVGALLAGSGELPKQALPAGALAQLRTVIDVDELLTVLRATLGSDLELPDELQKELVTALTGGVAIGITAPAPGGLIPRIYLSLGIADEAALRRFLAQTVAAMPTREATYDDVACTLVKFDDVPQGVQPAFCIHNDTLHVAESGRSLRAFLKVQDGETDAMDIGDAEVPEGPGELLPTFDLRLDEAALYEAFVKIWLPLYALIEERGGRAALQRGDMPPPDVVADYCGKSRGVMRRSGNRYLVQHLGVLGGPEMAALAMTWGPIMSSQMRDLGTENMTQAIATARLQTVWQALETFENKNQRWPADLAELFAASRLPEDALLLPGDDLAEDVKLAGGKTIRSSFRYFPTPVGVDISSGPVDMLLIEIRTKPWNRAMLSVDGETPRTYYGVSTQPIDQFGR